MSIIMTGGGTGGHLAIIRAVKEQLEGQNLIYVGSTKGQDRAWFAEDDAFEAHYFFQTEGVVNQRFLGKIKSLFALAKATYTSFKLLKKHQAEVVFSVGGFSSAPMAFASKLRGIPLVIHEQNAQIGTLNSLLKPYATLFLSSYLEESPLKAYPIQSHFFKEARLRQEVKTLLFLGGSQGARAINQLALSLAPELQKRGITILHQAGEAHLQEVKEAYKALGIEAEVFGFTSELVGLMKRADFAIARSGASTLWELSAMALPTLYIPYPYAVGDHQYYNARFLEEQGLAWIMRESELDATKVLALLEEDLEGVSQGLMQSIQEGGSEAIAQRLTQFLDK